MDELFDNYLNFTPFEGTASMGIGPHETNPYHELLTSLGWQYSHTTKIHYVARITALLVYKLPGLDNWSISVTCADYWRIESGRVGSAAKWTMYHTTHNLKLKKYLERKTKALRVEAFVNFSNKL